MIIGDTLPPPLLRTSTIIASLCPEFSSPIISPMM
jgi:hypothetical protein